METRELLIRCRIDASTLDAWIEAGWLAQETGDEAARFSDVDLARAQLIRDLVHDLGVNDEGVATILDLIDQIHGLRRSLGGLLRAVRTQPEAVQRQIAAILRDADPPSGDEGGRSGS